MALAVETRGNERADHGCVCLLVYYCYDILVDSHGNYERKKEENPFANVMNDSVYKFDK